MLATANGLTTKHNGWLSVVAMGGIVPRVLLRRTVNVRGQSPGTLAGQPGKRAVARPPRPRKPRRDMLAFPLRLRFTCATLWS